MTTNTHRLRPARPRWSEIATRAVSLVIVVAVGVGVYLGVERAERQECLNDAFRASLDERGKATDDLITSILAVNARLTATDGKAEQDRARRDFAADVARVRADRDAARAATDQRQEADCG